MVLYLKKLKSPSPKDALCQYCLKFAQWFWRRRFLNFVNVFSLFHNYLPLEKGGPFIWTKFNPLSHKDALCQIWLKLARWFWRRRFLNFVNVFSLFPNNPPWKRAGPFIWTKFNPLHPRMLCAKFGWNWLRGSGEENFFNFVNSLFCNYLPLQKGGVLHLNKLESPSP